MARLPGEPPDFKDISKPPPERTLKLPDGSVRTEKLPTMFNKKMVDPNGHVVRVALSNGATIKGIGPHNTYGMLKLAEKRRKGFILYDRCPYGPNGDLAATEHSEKPCKGKFSEEKCCPHVQQIIETRRRDYVKKRRRFTAKTESAMERMIKNINEKLATPEVPTDGKLKL